MHDLECRLTTARIMVRTLEETVAEQSTRIRELKDENALLHERCLKMNEAAEKLVDAVHSVQSWEDTWVGECIQYIDDLRYQPLPNTMMSDARSTPRNP